MKTSRSFRGDAASTIHISQLRSHAIFPNHDSKMHLGVPEGGNHPPAGVVAFSFSTPEGGCQKELEATTLRHSKVKLGMMRQHFELFPFRSAVSCGIPARSVISRGPSGL